MIYPALLIALTALFAWISWRDLRHGLYIIAATLPAYLLRFEIGGIPMTLLEVMIFVLFTIWTIRSLPLLKGEVGGGKLSLAGWTVPIVLLLTAATISIFVAPDKLAALGMWKAYFVEPILLFYVATTLTRKDEQTKDHLLTALCTGGLFVATFAIIQKLTGLGIPVPWDVEGRVTSIFPYPNAVGLYLGPLIVIAAMHAKKPFFLATAILGSVAIIFSQSEAAIVAVLATLFIAALTIRKLRIPAIAVAIIVTLAIALSPFRQTVFDKLTFNDYSGQVRRSQWEETINMLKYKPLFGAGLSGYPTALAPYHTHPEYEIFQYPHNIILNIWTELGLLGLVAIALLAWRVVRSTNLSALSAFTALAALLTITIHGLADVPYFKNDLAAMTWLLIAIIASLHYVLPPKNRDA